jgi:hypothetical protein
MTQESKAPAAASAAASAAAWLECGSGGAYWVMVVLSAVEDMALEKAGDAAGLQSKTAKASALLPPQAVHRRNALCPLRGKRKEEREGVQDSLATTNPAHVPAKNLLCPVRSGAMDVLKNLPRFAGRRDPRLPTVQLGGRVQLPEPKPAVWPFGDSGVAGHMEQLANMMHTTEMSGRSLCSWTSTSWRASSRRRVDEPRARLRLTHRAPALGWRA